MKYGEEKAEGEVDTSRGSVSWCRGKCKIQVKAVLSSNQLIYRKKQQRSVLVGEQVQGQADHPEEVHLKDGQLVWLQGLREKQQ